jgi:hypothetical protein
MTSYSVLPNTNVMTTSSPSSHNSSSESNVGLKHQDWVLRSAKRMLQQVNPNIMFKEIKRGNTPLLVVFNVSEQDLPNLNFFTNTDNNNYLYLETFGVYINDTTEQLIKVPGLAQLLTENWQVADNLAYRQNSQVFYPFTSFLVNKYTQNTFSISQYIDEQTSIIPWLPSTYGTPKQFTFVLNPDDDCIWPLQPGPYGVCTWPH